MDIVIAQILLAFVAGILLNLTPCVLPAIPLKVRAIIKETGKAFSHRLIAAFSFMFGSLIFFLILGALTGLLHLTWGAMFQSEIFLAFLSLLLFILGVTMLFSIDIPIPKFFYRIRGRSYLEPFLLGVLVAVLSTPCTGPFLGGVLAYALTQPTGVVIAFFAAIGIGLAFPYFIVILWPQLLSYIPHSGKWTVRVKQILASILLAGAIFFSQSMLPSVWVECLWYVWTAGVVVWACVVAYRAVNFTERYIPILYAVIVLAVIFSFIRSANKETLPWQSYTPAAFTSAIVNNKPVLIEFTADWCINCKVLESTVYENEKVVLAAKATNLVTFRIDLTKHSKEAETYLVFYGGAGIPFAVIISPNGKVVKRLYDIFTTDTLTRAIYQAGKEVDGQ